MGEFGYILGQVVGHLPTLLVLLVGMVLVGAARGRLPGRSWALAMAGLGMLLLGALLNVTWAVLFTRLVREGWAVRDIGAVGTGVGALLSIWHATGLGLLVGALLAGRRATHAPPPAG